MMGDEISILVVAEMRRLARVYQFTLLDEGYSVTKSMTDDVILESEYGTFDVVILANGLTIPGIASGVNECRESPAGWDVGLTSTLDRVFEVVNPPFSDYVLEEASKNDLAEVTDCVHERRCYGDPVQAFAQSMVTIAMVKSGTTEEGRETDRVYRTVVGRLLDRYVETSELISKPDGTDLRTTFGEHNSYLIHHNPMTTNASTAAE